MKNQKNETPANYLQPIRQFLTRTVVGDDEDVDFVFGDVLHNDDVRQVAAETVVMTLRQIVFRYDLRRGTTEKDGVAVFVHPTRPADFVQLLLQIRFVLHHSVRLLCPFVVPDGLDEPPELKRLYGVTRTVDHLHVAV